MKATDAFAPAKLNLTLHVTGRRDDGYHLLDSLVVFADVGDHLAFAAGADMAMSVSGPFADGVPSDSRNLVWRAAEMAGWCGHIALEKHLPHGAGIGGGSADAAAVLRHLHRPDLALSLGADVPVCLEVSPQRLQGIGEQLSRVDGVPALQIVLVNPGGHVATPDVFRALEQKVHPAMAALPTGVSRDGFVGWLATQRNDLERPAVTLAPRIQAALSALQDAELARMSGSGGTCFGIYPDEDAARSAAKRLSGDHPDWWVTAAKTTGSDVS